MYNNKLQYPAYCVNITQRSIESDVQDRSTHKLPLSRFYFFDNTFTTSKRENVVKEGTQN